MKNLNPTVATPGGRRFETAFLTAWRRTPGEAGIWQARIFAWSLVVACLLGAFSLRAFLNPLEGDKNPLLTFVLATLIAARYGGVWPGIVTGLGGLLVADYCFVEPRWTFLPIAKLHWISLLSYAGIVGAAITLFEALQRANSRAEEARASASAAEANVLRLNAELEERVQERTTALEEANRELEAFSYSVSHDLRAPVRTIAGFSQAVLEDYRDRLDKTGVKYLELVVEAGGRMGILIEDLMGLSMVARAELCREEVDLSQLALEAASRQQQQDPQRTCELHIAPGLSAHADPRLLRIVMDNLLSNAWKFTNRAPAPKIEMGLAGANRSGAEVFFVRDNGAGFDMARAGRLFGPFQRLHSDRDFPGTGIGLATVKRILARHGGHIWAEAKVGQGATFFFTVAPAARTVA